MTLDLTCQQCDASFELELAELMEDDKIQCPSCDAKAPRDVVDGLTSAFEELYGQLGKLQKRFLVTFAVENEELPSPFDREHVVAREVDDEEDEPDDALGEASDEDEDEPEDLDL